PLLHKPLELPPQGSPRPPIKDRRLNSNKSDAGSTYLAKLGSRFPATLTNSNPTHWPRGREAPGPRSVLLPVSCAIPQPEPECSIRSSLPMACGRKDPDIPKRRPNPDSKSRPARCLQPE